MCRPPTRLRQKPKTALRVVYSYRRTILECPGIFTCLASPHTLAIMSSSARNFMMSRNTNASIPHLLSDSFTTKTTNTILASFYTRVSFLVQRTAVLCRTNHIETTMTRTYHPVPQLNRSRLWFRPWDQTIYWSRTNLRIGTWMKRACFTNMGKRRRMFKMSFMFKAVPWSDSLQVLTVEIPSCGKRRPWIWNNTKEYIGKMSRTSETVAWDTSSWSGVNGIVHSY